MQLLSPPNMIFPGLVLGRDTGNGRFLLSLTPILVAIENPPLSSMKFPARNLHLQGIFHCHVWLSEGTSSMWRVSYIYNYVLIMYIYIYICVCTSYAPFYWCIISIPNLCAPRIPPLASLSEFLSGPTLAWACCKCSDGRFICTH